MTEAEWLATEDHAAILARVVRTPSARLRRLIVAARRHFADHHIPIQETTPIPGADRFFLSDPDGNRIEVIQWLQPYGPHAYAEKLAT